MRTLVIAAASALLLAALVTELTFRFWADNYTALLVITAIALLVNGLFNARLAAPTSVADQPAVARDQGQQRNRGRGNNKSSNQNNRSQGSNQGRGGQGRGGDKRRNEGRGGRQEQPKPNRDAPKPASKAPANSEEGSVKWFNRSKGYGFIVRANGDEIFVHQRSIDGARNLRDGQKVRFVVTQQDKGDQAEHVTPLD